MHPPPKRFYFIVVQTITISRALAALGFISIALIPKYGNIATGIFIYACLTDLLDGFLARKFNCFSNTGGKLDLFSDKYLTIVSLLYATVRGMPIVACSIAIFREVFLLSMRSIRVNGKEIFPPQRLLGALMVIPIWLGALTLLQYPEKVKISLTAFQYLYDVIGVLTFINLVYKIIINWKLLIQSFNQ
jgi:phosphatidylglycerophosphate synthase